jgi:hypothetical protein
MIAIEENIILEDDLAFHNLRIQGMQKLIPKYSLGEIAYASVKAVEADLIDANIIDYDSGIADIIYLGLTYEGHQFLDNVRDNKIWSKTKAILSKIGGASLKIISSVATSQITEEINNLRL